MRIYMDKEKTKLLLETIELATALEKSIVCSEIAINNGEIMGCQKYTKEATKYLDTMSKDVFKEFFDIFEISSTETIDTPIPSALEICKLTSDMCHNIAFLLEIDLEGSNSASNSTLLKIAKDINTILELYRILYAN